MSLHVVHVCGYASTVMADTWTRDGYQQQMVITMLLTLPSGDSGVHGGDLLFLASHPPHRFLLISDVHVRVCG